MAQNTKGNDRGQKKKTQWAKGLLKQNNGEGRSFSEVGLNSAAEAM